MLLRQLTYSRSALDPLRAAAYLGILVVFCAVFSLIWLEVGGLGPEKLLSNSWIQACKFLATADQADPSNQSSNATYL